MRVAHFYVASAALLFANAVVRAQHAIERKDVEFSNDALRLAGPLYLPQRAAHLALTMHHDGEDRVGIQKP